LLGRHEAWERLDIPEIRREVTIRRHQHALAEAHAKELGYEPTLDPDFAADLEEIIRSRKPRNISP